MKNEHQNNLLETLQAYQQNPTYGHEVQLSMFISMATSLAAIADVISDNNDITEDKESRMCAKWHRVIDGNWVYAKCSSCGSLQDVKSNYCPNCGAKMEESEDGESI